MHRDPGNRLRLLALIHAATKPSLKQTIADAQQHHYTPAEVAELLNNLDQL